MNKNQVIASARESISSAKTEEALDIVIAFFEGKNKYTRLHNIATQIKAQYTKATEQTQKGVLSSENATLQFNQVNETLLTLLTDLENDNLNPSRYNIEKDLTSNRRLWISGLTLFVLALGVTFAIWRFFPTNDTGCPVFPKDSAFNLLLLPFENLAGDPMKPEIPIKERLTELCNQHDINGSVEIYKTFLQQNEDFPTTYNEAEAIARPCLAKMIIWGTTERSTEGIFVKTKFKYLSGADAFSFRKIKMEGQTQIDTIRSISSIATEGQFTRKIDQLILTIFGIVAYDNENYAVAIENLEKVQPLLADTNDVLLINMLLADSYLAMKNDDQALKTYDQLLDIHPNYEFALNNRGMLLYKKGQYIKAVQDFSAILKNKPNDVEALKARGMSNTQLEKRRSVEQNEEE